MTQQFGRQYRLEVGNATAGIAIDGLRVAFDVSKTIDSKPNPGKIQIWNLNRSNMAALLDGRYDRARLWVGYETMRVLYAGDIVKPRVKRDGMDFVLELECGDGDVDHRTARVATSLGAGTRNSDALRAAASSMGRATPGAMDVPRDTILPRGRVLNGAARDVLTDLGADQGADWSVQDGELVFIPTDKVLPTDAVELSQETGMVGGPQATDNGLELTCLLNPALAIGGLVRVRSILPWFDGDYKIVALQHSGDALGGDWLTKITAVGGKFKKIESKS